jgi:hypothetical protein
MTEIKLLVPIVLLLSILLFHINNGLTSLIVFPTIIIILLLTILLSVNSHSNFIKYIVILNVAVTMAILSYSLVPYSVADRYTDANYVFQLVRLFSAERRVMPGVGTNQAYEYSFYPLFEIWLIILSYYNNVDPVYIMRIFPIFSIFYYFITWISIYKFINRQIYIEAAFLSLLSFHFSIFIIRPLHPSYVYMLFSVLILISLIGISRGYNFNSLIQSMVIIGIVMGHNTTGFILIATLMSFFLIYTALYKFLRITFFLNSMIMRRVLLMLLLILVAFLLYNLYVSAYFFGKGTVRGVITYLSYVIEGDVLPFDVIFQFRRPLNINIDLVAPSFSGWIVDRGRIYLGFFGLALYLFVFLLVTIRILFNKYSLNFTSISSFFLMLSFSISLIIVIATFTWPAFYISDYYWRFYSYFFFFSSPFVVWYIYKLRKRIAMVLFFVILFNTFIGKPSLAFGIDTPFELSDPRIGIKESVVLASYLAERYDGSVIVGTRYAYNVIGPLSTKTTITIYSDKDLEMLSISRVNNYLFVFSSIETKMLRISTSVQEGNLLYKSGDFFVYK